jgi:hypothetical protein
MLLPGEDEHGFRAIAERSVLADRVKDSGAVSLFPQLASHWKDQVRAQSGWENFRLADFQNLAGQYPVTWILTRSPAPDGLTCPYQSHDLVVCRIDAGATPMGSMAGGAVEIRALAEPPSEARPRR